MATGIKRKHLSTYMFLLPAVVIMGSILLYPIINGLRLSFFEWQMRNLSKSPVWIGLRNYRELFADPFFWESFVVTLKFSFAVVVIELLVGMILALLLEKGIKGLRFFRTTFILPIMVAPVVVGVIWRFLYNPSYGKINYFITSMGFQSVGWLSDPNIALWSVIIADIWQWTPFVFLLLLAGLQGVPKELSEASMIDGANYFQDLIHIKIPSIESVIWITVVLRMIDSFRSLVVVFNLTYGGPGLSTEVLSLHLYKTAFIGQRLGLAAANAMVLLAIVMVLSLLLILRRDRRS
ncbi:MAG: sugar ABC transporter permease [Spirochaetaceae bacterium]|nr:sugar ABC transporter permease [Spirochaetaceae bacterium]